MVSIKRMTEIRNIFLHPLNKILEKNGFNPIYKLFFDFNFIDKYDDEILKKMIADMKTFDKNQLNIFRKMLESNFFYFSYNINKNRLQNFKYEINKINKRFISDFNKIKNKKLISTRNYKNLYHRACESTYIGFLNGLTTKSLVLTNLKIEGKDKLVLMKYGKSYDPNKNFDVVKVGINQLILDPSTMVVYKYSTNPNGEIINLKKEYSIKNLESPRYEKEYINNLKRELLKYIDQTYAKKGVGGIKRLKKTFEERKLQGKKGYGVLETIKSLKKPLKIKKR